LDSTNKELPEICKTKIQDLMKEQFGLELHEDQVGDDEIDRTRQNAFRLARQILIQGKAVSYAERRRIEIGYAVAMLIALFSIGYALGIRYMVLARQGAILAVLSMWAMGRPCLLRLLPTDSRRTALPSLSGKWPGKFLPHP
jgi:hypothetical protein